jgi:hypothetical protein
MRRRALPLLAVAAALPATAPGAAVAAFQAEPIPGTSGALAPVTLGVDRDGRALAVFEGITQGAAPHRFTGTALRAPGGRWTRGGDLAGLGWGNAAVHLYARTRALLVARQVTGYGAFNRARFRLVWAPGSSDGTFSALRPIAASADAPASAASASGDALVAFARQGGSQLQVAERPAGGGFGAARPISPSGVFAPAVAIGERGDRLVAWLRGGRIEARVRRAGHGWGSVLPAGRLPTGGTPALRALVTANGRFVLAWQAATIREGRPVQLETGAAVRTRTGGWHAATLSRATLPTEGFAADPAAIPLVDTAGRLWVAATIGGAQGPSVALAHLSPTARVVGSEQLSAAGEDATLDDAAAGPGDRLAVTWARHAPGGALATVVRVRAGAAPFGAAETLTPAGEPGLVGSRVAFSPLDGTAVVVRPLVSGGTGALAGAAGG